MTKRDWQINIENLASRVAEKRGGKAVASVFAQYDATCFDDLNPIYYSDVSNILEMMEED